jgi:hypothetical protein
MFSKFKEGLLFGGGFGISFISIWYIASFFITPLFVSAQIEDMNEKIHSMNNPSSEVASESIDSLPHQKQFHELSTDEQIKTASVILLTKHVPTSTGKVKAVITQFIKKDENITFYYKIGDELESSSYYPRENTIYGDGRVVFFAGNPPREKMSMTYTGDRVGGLGDMPLEILKKKCSNTKA